MICFIKKIFLFFIIFYGVLASSASYANERACDDLGGGVIFKDMLYGVGTGAVLTVLALTVTDDHENYGRKIAAGSLFAGGVGVGIGVYETLSRQCRTVVGWQRPDLFISRAKTYLDSKDKYGVSVKYIFN